MYYPATEVLEHFIKESDNEKITKFFYNDDYLLMLKDETQQKIREDNYKKFKECYREKSLDIKKTIIQKIKKCSGNDDASDYKKLKKNLKKG